MEFKFIGHCRDLRENHDKVWGVIYLQDPAEIYNAKCLVFWGRRGKKLSTKVDHESYTLTKLVRAKQDKGYKEVNVQRLHEVYPEFQTDLEKTAMWATLMA
jgi:hypothetical protein